MEQECAARSKVTALSTQKQSAHITLAGVNGDLSSLLCFILISEGPRDAAGAGEGEGGRVHGCRFAATPSVRTQALFTLIAF